MSDNPKSPLLGAEADRQHPRRPASQRSRHSDDDVESTPLLSRESEHRSYDDVHRDPTSPAASSLRSLQNRVTKSKKDIRRWSTIFAITLLCLTVVTILGLGFAAPAVVEEYARESVEFKPTSLSIDSFTSNGVKARIQGDFTLDASKVKKKSVRDIGRAGTWIASKVEAKHSKVQVVLPEYGNLLLGTADIPSVVVDVRDGHVTHIDIVADLNAGDSEAIIRMGRDWVDGRLDRLRVHGQANVRLQSGIFSFGTQSITEYLEFKSKLSINTGCDCRADFGPQVAISLLCLRITYQTPLFMRSYYQKGEQGWPQKLQSRQRIPCLSILLFLLSLLISLLRDVHLRGR